MITKNLPPKLKYAGKFEFIQDGRIWNIIDPSSPYHKSTRTLEGLRELGIVPEAA